MRTIAALVLVGSCTPDAGLEAAGGTYAVTARHFDARGTCTAPGIPTDPEQPYFQLVTSGEDRLAHTWCMSPMQCDPIDSSDWFDAAGDHWHRATAVADDRGFCSLGYDRLVVERKGDAVHVDLLGLIAITAPGHCTEDFAVEALEDFQGCANVDRYDLVPVR
jgi:hypothetical protein